MVCGKGGLAPSRESNQKVAIYSLLLLVLGHVLSSCKKDVNASSGITSSEFSRTRCRESSVRAQKRKRARKRCFPRVVTDEAEEAAFWQQSFFHDLLDSRPLTKLFPNFLVGTPKYYP